MDLAEERRIAADNAFAWYDLGDQEVEGGNGWSADGDEWSQVFFVKDQPSESRREVFVVRFQPGLAEVADAYIAG
jgi:hypothetical protein